jgi:hypothetical protein
MIRHTRSGLKCFVAVALFALMVGASAAADITPDAPIAGPAKITVTGKWRIGPTETVSAIRVIATPSGGGQRRARHGRDPRWENGELHRDG